MRVLKPERILKPRRVAVAGAASDSAIEDVVKRLEKLEREVEELKRRR